MKILSLVLWCLAGLFFIGWAVSLWLKERRRAMKYKSIIDDIKKQNSKLARVLREDGHIEIAQFLEKLREKEES